MKNYLVVAITNNAEIKALQVYSNQLPALDRAFALAGDLAENSFGWVEPEPAEEVLDNGSSRWVFLETNRQFVACYHVEVDELQVTFIPPATIPTPVRADIVLPQLTYAQIQEQINKSRMERSLPGGFCGNKPMRMEDLLDDPYSVDPASALTKQQRTALVLARIRAIPNYSWGLSGVGFNRDGCIAQINLKSTHGQMIIDEECEFLDSVRDKRIEEISFVEEESSSSESEEW